MSILHITGLVVGHCQCRSLSETLPIFTDLLAMEGLASDGARQCAFTSAHHVLLPARRAEV
jgi:hypothetical protein